MTRRTQDRKSPPLIDRFLSQSLGDGGLDPQSALKLRDVAWLAGLAAGGGLLSVLGQMIAKTFLLH